MNWKDISANISDQCIGAFSEAIEIHYYNSETLEFEIVTASGVYDSDYKQIDMQTGAVISSNAPMIEVSLRLLARVLTNRDKIQVRSILYKIKEVQPDESGAIKILLGR
jgi:uncharacterized protein YraI